MATIFKLVFSQYGKYVTPVCLFFIFNQMQIKNPGAFVNLKDLFFLFDDSDFFICCENSDYGLTEFVVVQLHIMEEE